MGHTLLVQSDGRAIACGFNIHGQCDLPVAKRRSVASLFSGDCRVSVVPSMRMHSLTGPGLVVQLSCNIVENDQFHLEGVGLSGEILFRLNSNTSELVGELHDRIMQVTGTTKNCLSVVLPDGRLLSSFDPSTSVTELRLQSVPGG